MNSRVFTIGICAVLLYLSAIYILKKLRPINSYNKARKQGVLERVTGVVVAFVETEMRSANGKKITFSYPEYEYVVNGQRMRYISDIKKANVKEGDITELQYSAVLKEAWEPAIFPAIKRGIYIEVAVTVISIALLLITEFI